MSTTSAAEQDRLGAGDSARGVYMGALQTSGWMIWLVPLMVLLLAFATSGIAKSLSLQYLQMWAVSLPIVGAFALLEGLVPSAGPRKHFSQVILNLQVGIVLYLSVAITALVAFVTSVVGRHLGTGWIDLHFLSGDSLWARVATVIMSWLVFDFFYYWYHRSQHTFAFLWQIHKLHHTDEQVSVTTKLRANLSDAFLNIFVTTVPVALLFRFDPVAMAKLSTFMKLATEVIGCFIHANIRLSLGWASVLMVGPQAHRIHHSQLIQHHNRNFCLYFPIWDILFGTYYHPSRSEFPPTGIDRPDDVSSVGEAVALPFRGWWAMFYGWRQKAHLRPRPG